MDDRELAARLDKIEQIISAIYIVHYPETKKKED